MFRRSISVRSDIFKNLSKLWWLAIADFMLNIADMEDIINASCVIKIRPYERGTLKWIMDPRVRVTQDVINGIKHQFFILIAHIQEFVAISGS